MRFVYLQTLYVFIVKQNIAAHFLEINSLCPAAAGSPSAPGERAIPASRSPRPAVSRQEATPQVPGQAKRAGGHGNGRQRQAAPAQEAALLTQLPGRLGGHGCRHCCCPVPTAAFSGGAGAEPPRSPAPASEGAAAASLAAAPRPPFRRAEAALRGGGGGGGDQPGGQPGNPSSTSGPPLPAPLRTIPPGGRAAPAAAFLPSVAAAASAAETGAEPTSPRDAAVWPGLRMAKAAPAPGSGRLDPWRRGSPRRAAVEDPPGGVAALRRGTAPGALCPSRAPIGRCLATGAPATDRARAPPPRQGYLAVSLACRLANRC